MTNENTHVSRLHMADALIGKIRRKNDPDKASVSQRRQRLAQHTCIGMNQQKEAMWGAGMGMTAGVTV